MDTYDKVSEFLDKEGTDAKVWGGLNKTFIMTEDAIYVIRGETTEPTDEELEKFLTDIKE